MNERSRIVDTVSDHAGGLNVSVVVPVFESPDRIRECIEALLRQTYPRHLVELLIVDNGSRDTTREVIRSYPVNLVLEDSVRSPYAARNVGIARSSGDVVAMTDANCVPAPEWLENGVRALVEGDADLAGGRVTFTFPGSPSVGELTDALINVDVEESIRSLRACMTGNLFVRRAVFDGVGLFEADLRSGGDMRWTRRATDAGHRLVYAPAAEVGYPARPLGPLLKKQYRVGRGVPGVWAELGYPAWRMAASAVRGALPMPPHRLPARIEQRDLARFEPPRARLWLAVWAAKAARAAGCVHGLLAGGIRRTT
jgi:glycosyltransferase involved in cell wall biosynthesis